MMVFVAANILKNNETWAISLSKIVFYDRILSVQSVVCLFQFLKIG